jgi:hypothetical protein
VKGAEDHGVLNLRQYAYGYGLLGQSAHFLQLCMKLMLDLSTSAISQYHQSLPSNATCLFGASNSLRRLFNFSANSALPPATRVDWLFRIQSCVDNIQKETIPLKSTLDEMILARTQKEDVVLSCQALLSEFLKEFTSIDILLSYIIVKLSSKCLEWLILILSFGTDCKNVDIIEADSLKEEDVSDKSKKALLIVDMDEGSKQAYRFKPAIHKINLILSLVNLFERQLPGAKIRLESLIEEGKNLIKTQKKSSELELITIASKSKIEVRRL